mmetsp:Transcript_34848/g.87349  ORF Transcript_34848/g.87349 Transcript_34848/m.87349 type:complete len:226 (+) Transcript_34848:436-1113(+)
MKYGIAHGLDVDMLAFSKPFFLAACSPTLNRTTLCSMSSVSLGAALPYTAPCTLAIIFAISRPLNPSICFAMVLSAALFTSSVTAMGVLLFPPPRLPPPPKPMAANIPCGGASSPASSPLAISLSKYSCTILSRASRSGRPISMASSMRSSTAESRSSGRLVAMTSTTSRLSSPVRYRSAFSAARTPGAASAAATEPPRLARNASASSINSSSPLREVEAQSKSS